MTAIEFDGGALLAEIHKLRREFEGLFVDRLEINVMTLGPDDKIIVRPGRTLTSEQIMQLQDVAERMLDHKCVVIPHEMQIEVMAAPKAPEPPAPIPPAEAPKGEPGYD